MQSKAYEPITPSKGREARPPCSLLYHLEEQCLPPGPPPPYQASEGGERYKPKSQPGEQGDATTSATAPNRHQEGQPMLSNVDVAFKKVFKGRNTTAAASKTTATVPTITGT